MTNSFSHLERLFPGDSEMAGRMRAFDWSASALGSTHDWPENLRVAIRLCLTSRFPICLWWARPLRFLYNDAFRPWLSDAKHSRALMQLGREVWSEDWDTIDPMLERVLATGNATWSEDKELYHNRKVEQEEVYITWSFTPILAADGHTVDGIFCPCSETTEKVIGARRLETLRKLAIRASEARSVDAACDEAVAVLGENARDIPFAAIYVAGANGDDARLSAAVLPRGEHCLPSTVRASDDDAASPWPLARVLRTKGAADCLGIDARGVQLHAGPWPDITQTALVIPIQAAQDNLAGLLVVGISPRRPLDAEYRTFFDLVAGHVATALSVAREYEAQRQRAEALAEIDRAKTAFFSNVSHEFRTPLTLMLGPIEDMLARAGPAITIPRDELDLVHRNTLRLLKLVNTLLDFSRIEAGRVQAAYEPVDLSAYTGELASMFRAAVESVGLRLRVDCPDLGEPVYVDRSMWEKIVLNLLSNAFKFTFDGEIEVSLRRDAERAQLSVRDTGTGIATPDLPRLFERFQRIEGARGRTHEGSGIGLALVRELAELHGGSVRAESAYGQGSQFTVTIPLGHAHLPPEHTGPTRPSTVVDARAYVEEALRWRPDVSDEVDRSVGDAAAEDGMPPRLLFADDNADLRQYVQRLLGKSYEVHLAADGETALTAALRQPPDLVLADIMMPRLDGFELLQRLRRDPRTRNVPVILLSARAGEETRVEGLAAGANDYVIKPFSARELLARVRACLDTSRASREALRRERTLRQSAEHAKTRTKEELAFELAAMNRLHELSTRLVAETELEPLLEEVLDASIALLEADFGSVQLYDEATGTLTVVAQRGFTREFLDYFGRLHEGTAACGEPARRRDRIIVEDVRTDPLFAPHVDVVSAAGYRAVQSTPMLGNRGQVLGVISTHFRHPHRPSERELRFVDLYARQAAAMIEHKRAEEARNELVRRLFAAQEDERRRISREMHDDFGQQVSALRMRIAALKRDYSGHANLVVQLAPLEGMVKQLDSDVDLITWQLRPAALDDLGLGAALTSYVKIWSEHFDVRAELHVSGMEANRLTTERETALYRVMQEALNNVAKHAHARHVIIALQCWSDRVSLIVEDDGVGFDRERVVAAVDKQLGLVGMRERALLLGGTLDVESQPGRGTTVVARIPAGPSRISTRDNKFPA